MDDLDDLLPRRHGLEYLIAEGLLLYPLQEVPGYLEVHVGFEEHPADFPEPLANHGFGQEAPLPELGENAVELFAQIVEHEFR